MPKYKQEYGPGLTFGFDPEVPWRDQPWADRQWFLDHPLERVRIVDHNDNVWLMWREASTLHLQGPYDAWVTVQTAREWDNAFGHFAVVMHDSSSPTIQGPLTLAQVKEAFWTQIINVGKGVKRLVAHSRNVQENFKYTESDRLQLWVPESRDDQFNLVLSLCTDGRHRFLMDVDDPAKEKALPERYIRTPSTRNAHYWGSNIISYPTLMALAKDVNDGYWEANKDKSFAGLRPPWVVKPGSEGELREFSTDQFKRLKFADVEPEPEGIGWEDLFNES